MWKRNLVSKQLFNCICIALVIVFFAQITNLKAQEHSSVTTLQSKAQPNVTTEEKANNAATTDRKINYFEFGFMMKCAGVILLTLFMPATAFTFYLFRLRKKKREFAEIMGVLKEKEEVPLSISSNPLSGMIQREYSVAEYGISVGFVSILCLLGLTALFMGTEIGLADTPNLLFSGTHFGDKEYQRVSLVVLTMGFMGAYIWSIQDIVRRWITLDLDSGAYFYVGIRMVFAAFVALILHHFLGAFHSGSLSEWKYKQVQQALPAIAFITGVFPYRVLYWLKEQFPFFSEKGTEKATNLPLDMIEGISVYKKFRLNEVGIDNAQNLAEAGLVRLLIKTPYEPLLLIDWIGQAKLYVHFKSDFKELKKFCRTILDFKKLGDSEGKLSEVAEHTKQIPDCESRLNSFYQIIKDDHGIAQLFKFKEIFS